MTSPGASSVPASKDPIITALAPAAKALTTSPENLSPPSAMTGMPVPFKALAEGSNPSWDFFLICLG